MTEKNPNNQNQQNIFKLRSEDPNKPTIIVVGTPELVKEVKKNAPDVTEQEEPQDPEDES